MATALQRIAKYRTVSWDMKRPCVMLMFAKIYSCMWRDRINSHFTSTFLSVILLLLLLFLFAETFLSILYYFVVVSTSDHLPKKSLPAQHPLLIFLSFYFVNKEKMTSIASTVTTCFTFSYFRLFPYVFWVHVSDTYTTQRWWRTNVFFRKRSHCFRCVERLSSCRLRLIPFMIFWWNEECMSSAPFTCLICALTTGPFNGEKKNFTLNLTNCYILCVYERERERKMCVLRNQDTIPMETHSIFRFIFILSEKEGRWWWSASRHSLNHIFFSWRVEQ